MGFLLTMARVAAVAACMAGAMLLPGQALAKEYGHYDFKLVLVPAASPGTAGRLDIGYLDRMMWDVGQHGDFSQFGPNSAVFGGEHVNLSPGMNITAGIKTGKRPIIEYLLGLVQKAGSERLREG